MLKSTLSGAVLETARDRVNVTNRAGLGFASPDGLLSMILRAVFVVAVECPLAPFELAVWLSLAESVGISASTTTELIKDSFRGVVMLRSCVAFLAKVWVAQHFVLRVVIVICGW